MKNVKYVCSECGYQAEYPGLCPKCEVPLVASCPECGNPVVGEHIHLDD